MKSKLDHIIDLYPKLLRNEEERQAFARMIADPVQNKLFRVWLVGTANVDWDDANHPATPEELQEVDAHYRQVRLYQEASRAEPYIWN